jgi:hypothetical protein
MPVRRHHDQIEVLRLRVFRNGQGGIAFFKDSLYVKPAPLVATEILHPLLSLLSDEAMNHSPLSRCREGRFETRRQHVKQRDLGLEVFGDCRGGICRIGGTCGEIDWQQNLRYVEHLERVLASVMS